jgi:hypothetical protein
MSVDCSLSPSQPPDQNPPISKMFEREDWTLFHTVEGLCQRAGVPAKWLRRLVMKELADNGLDTYERLRARHDEAVERSLKLPKIWSVQPCVSPSRADVGRW